MTLVINIRLANKKELILMFLDSLAYNKEGRFSTGSAFHSAGFTPNLTEEYHSATARISSLVISAAIGLIIS